MTIYLPLEPSSPFPQSPHFLVPSAEPNAHVQKVVKAILKARRIAVVCGAGISVRAGIPDFRSETGLFHTLKKDHSSLSSGKDLFDASVFNSEATTALFCQMIAQLSQLSMVAEPTAFHHLLRALDDRGRLLRVYTQNIDALELKSGLTFGVPELDTRRWKPRSTKGKIDHPDTPVSPSAPPPAPRLPTPPAETPRCIPLHGTLQSMHCQICLHSFPLENYLGDLNAGSFPICPDCNQVEETRQAVGKRSRGVGKLRPSVVLYNELHKDGEEVGEVVRRDLVGNSKGKGRAGADLLLVVGTSLRVPGTKRMVREFSKAVHSRAATSTQSEASTTSPTSISTSSTLPSPRRTPPVADEDAPIKTIYLNLDFPVPTREWEGVFDVWVRGDAQTFANMVREEIEKEERAKEAAIERKRKREEMKEEAARADEERQRQVAEESAAAAAKSKKGKGKQQVYVVTNPGKRKKHPTGGLPTPSHSVKKRKMGVTPKHRSSPSKHHTSPTVQVYKPLIIRIPARPRPTHFSSEEQRLYTPLTPPSSQPSHEIMSKLAPHPHHWMSSHPIGTQEATPPSSPLSPPPPTSPYAAPSSPLTPCSSSESSSPSPLTSLVSSAFPSPVRTPPYTPFAPLSHTISPVICRRRPSLLGIPRHLSGEICRIQHSPGNEDTEEDVVVDV